MTSSHIEKFLSSYSKCVKISNFAFNGETTNTVFLQISASFCKITYGIYYVRILFTLFCFTFELVRQFFLKFHNSIKTHRSLGPDNWTAPRIPEQSLQEFDMVFYMATPGFKIWSSMDRSTGFFADFLPTNTLKWGKKEQCRSLKFLAKFCVS